MVGCWRGGKPRAEPVETSGWKQQARGRWVQVGLRQRLSALVLPTRLARALASQRPSAPFDQP